MSEIKFSGESAQNYEQKCLCVLVLDTSGSMCEIVDNSNAVPTGESRVIDGVRYNIVKGGISRLDKLREGLSAFFKEIANDMTASEKLEIAIITFDDNAKMIQSPALIDDITMPNLYSGGMTDMAGAMELAMDVVEGRKSWYRTTHQNYYRPWIVLMTDGEPNEGQDIQSLAREIKDEVSQKHFQFLPIGVDNANMEILRMLSADLPAMPLSGTKFMQFFKWLSSSMGMIVNSREGDKVDLSRGASEWMDNLGNYEI